MITFEKFGYSFKFCNDDWRKLRIRFDLTKAKAKRRDRKDYYYIDTGGQTCPLCVRYHKYNCVGCPFDQMTLGKTEFPPGCARFLIKWFPALAFDTTVIFHIEWPKHDNKHARRQLRRINEEMDSIELLNKIEGNLTKK